MPSARRHLLLEGWRTISQSYAVINQWLLLAMARRGDLRLSVRDLPYLNADWVRAKGLFEAHDERRWRRCRSPRPASMATPRCG